MLCRGRTVRRDVDPFLLSRPPGILPRGCLCGWPFDDGVVRCAATSAHSSYRSRPASCRVAASAAAWSAAASLDAPRRCALPPSAAAWHPASRPAGQGAATARPPAARPPPWLPVRRRRPPVATRPSSTASGCRLPTVALCPAARRRHRSLRQLPPASPAAAAAWQLGL